MIDGTAGRVLAHLDAQHGLKLRARGGGRYKLNSPLRPGSDSGDFSLELRDAEHGVWHDGPSGEGGSLYELAARLGIEAGQQAPAAPLASTKRAYADLADYAAAHGATAADYTAAGWAETTYAGRPALGFTTASGVRWRFIDGQRPAFANTTGYQSCWYGLRRAIEIASRSGGPLVLCNGEASVVAAQSHGVPAAAVTSGGERMLSDNLLAELQSAWQGAVLVALDCDQKGRQAAPELAGQLRSAGLEAASIDLGGADGFDLADFCRLYESDAYASLVELARKRPASSKIIHADDLRRLPPPEWLVRGWIVARGLNVVYGAPGTGKSTRVLDWACRLSQTHKILYVAAEDAGGYAPRHDGWKIHHGQQTPGLYFWPEEVNALDPASVDAFVQAILPERFDLVVFDTLARCMPGGNDADAASIGMFIAMCDRVRRECGSAALAVHHTGKNGEYRGHSSLLGAADMFVRFDDRDELRITTVEKAKNSQPAPPLRERFVVVETSMMDAETGKPITTVVLVPDAHVEQMRDARLTANQMRVLETLCMRIFDERGVAAIGIAEATGLAKSSLYHTLSILRKRHYIEYVSARSNNLLPTADGRQAFIRQYRESEAAAPAPDTAAESPGPDMPMLQSQSTAWSGERGPELGSVNMDYIATLLAVGNRNAVRLHCALHQADYAAVLAAAGGEEA